MDGSRPMAWSYFDVRYCFGLGEILAESVEAALQTGAPLSNPLRRTVERVRDQVARAGPADLLGSHQSAGLEYLEVLYDGGQ